MATLYYATDEGEILGPFDVDALNQMHGAGLIDSQTLVAEDGDKEWVTWRQKLDGLMVHAIDRSENKEGSTQQPAAARIETSADAGLAPQPSSARSETLETPGNAFDPTTYASVGASAQSSAQDLAVLKAKPGLTMRIIWFLAQTFRTTPIWVFGLLVLISLMFWPLWLYLMASGISHLIVSKQEERLAGQSEKSVPK